MITELIVRVSFHMPDEVQLMEDFKKANNMDNWQETDSTTWVIFETVKREMTRKEQV